MLTTRCPHCSTVFRVRPEQLSMRGGRVRCGHCQQAFSALAHLEEMGDDTPVITPKAPSSAKPPAPVAPPPSIPQAAPRHRPIADAPVPLSAPAPAPWPAQDPDPQRTLITPTPAFSAHSNAWMTPDEPEPPRAQTSANPLPRIPSVPEAPSVGDDFSISLPDIGSHLPGQPASGDIIEFDFSGLDDDEPAPAVAAPKPATATTDHAAVARSFGVKPFEPDTAPVFDQTLMLEEPVDLMNQGSLLVEHERQYQEKRSRVELKPQKNHAFGWFVGVSVLLVLIALQLTYVFRTDVAREVPALRPHLERACEWLGCTVAYPRNAEAISLEGHSFNPDTTGAEGRFRLIVTLLNKANYPQAWPHLELTVTDRFDIAVSRRILKPAEWLPAAYASQAAFEGNSEVTANLSLMIENAQAAGYRLYVFYP